MTIGSKDRVRMASSSPLGASSGLACAASRIRRPRGPQKTIPVSIRAKKKPYPMMSHVWVRSR